MSKRWYIATTVGRHHDGEHLAAVNLKAAGLRAWVPITYSRDEAATRKRKPVPDPRFGGYVFVYFDADLEEHSPIYSTVGVGKLLCDMDEMRTPRPLPSGVVEALQAQELSEYLSAKSAADTPEQRGIIPGSGVTVARLDGLVGKLVGTSDGKATVLVGNRIVTVSVFDIALAAADPRKKYAA